MAIQNESLILDVKQAARYLENVSRDFDKVIGAYTNLVKELSDLQNEFYSPNGKDSTLIYQECAKNLGNSNSDQGLYASIKGAYDWCSAVDQYVQDQEYRQSNGNPYDD